jgi:GntR family transcriptional regulator
MRRLGLEPGVELVELGPVTPPPEIAERRGLKAGEKALVRRRQLYAGGQPMQFATSYIPWSLAEGTHMVERDSGPGGIYSRLADVSHGRCPGSRPIRSRGLGWVTFVRPVVRGVGRRGRR